MIQEPKPISTVVLGNQGVVFALETMKVFLKNNFGLEMEIQPRPIHSTLDFGQTRAGDILFTDYKVTIKGQGEATP